MITSNSIVDDAVSDTPTALEVALSVRNLSRSFDDIPAVRDLTFQVAKGTITAFLGRNGAGKSTTIACLTGLLEPDEGSFTLFGQSLSLPQIRRKIGVLPQDLGLFDELTVEENISIQAKLFGLDPVAIRERTRFLLQKLLLTDEKDRRCGTLSSGTRKRAAFAVAVAHQPAFLFLDEPFENVDPIGVIAMKDWMRHFVRTEGGAILLTTHVLDTVEKLCDYGMILEKGRLVWQADLVKKDWQWQGAEVSSLEDLFLAIANQKGASQK
jgi:ABC-type multidrug transport system ATPase subunit